MTEPLLFSVAKTIASPVLKLLAFVYGRFRRPSVEYRRAPKNLFQHVKPGASVARMKDLLGTPHQESEGQYRYVFSEACVQVDSSDKTTIDSISVGLVRVNRRNRFHVWPMQKLILGKTTFVSVLEPEDKIVFDYSSKFYHFYVVKYFGFPGLYWNYALGVLECPGVLPERHHWSPEIQKREEIPREMKINWASVTRLPEPPRFNYYGFI